MNNLAEKKFILLNEDTIEIDLDSSSSYKLDFKSIKYKIFPFNNNVFPIYLHFPF